MLFRSLVIPAGTHRLPKSDGTWCLLVRDAKDLEIDARGAEFVIADPRNGGIQFLRCRNVRLKGLSLRHETPPFTQGRIDAVGGKSIDVRLHAGYPDLAERPTGYVFDPKTRRIKDGTFDLTATQVERLEPHQVRLHFAETYFTTAGQRFFNVAINGTPALTNFDIATAAGASNKALVKEFTAVADGSGNINITFTWQTNWPLVNGVEILH